MVEEKTDFNSISLATIIVMGILVTAVIISAVVLPEMRIHDTADVLRDYEDRMREVGRSEDYIEGWINAVNQFEYELTAPTNATSSEAGVI